MRLENLALTDGDKSYMRSLIQKKNTLEEKEAGEERVILATRKGKKAPSDNSSMLVNPDESQSVASGSHESGVGFKENDYNLEKKIKEEDGEYNEEEEETTEEKEKVVFSSRNLRISGLSSTTTATDLKVKKFLVLGSKVLVWCHECHPVQYSLGCKFQTYSEARSSELAHSLNTILVESSHTPTTGCLLKVGKGGWCEGDDKWADAGGFLLWLCHHGLKRGCKCLHQEL